MTSSRAELRESEQNRDIFLQCESSFHQQHGERRAFTGKSGKETAESDWKGLSFWCEEKTEKGE